MNDYGNGGDRPWTAPTSSRVKNVVQRSVTALLDALAPESVLTRAERARGRIEQHRTPAGCVLQAADAALTVSWFPEGSSESPLGELHVLVWRGRVTRRGSASPHKGASIVSTLLLRPIEPAENEAQWLATDGSRYTTASLAAMCMKLLEEQIAGRE